MPTEPMAIREDDRRDPHVVSFGQPPVAVKLFRPIPSARLRSTSILPMYVRLAPAARAGKAVLRRRASPPVSLESRTHDVS